MQKARAQLALLRFARLIVCQLGSISSLRLIPTIHSFSSLRVQRNTHGALANPDLSQAMAPSKQKRTHAVFRVSSAHRLASTSKPRFVGERVKLGDVLQVVNGKNQKAVKDENGQYPIYGSGGQMGWASSYICPADTVIIGRKGNINKPIYVSEPFWNVDTAFGLVAKPELLDARYLYHFCKHYDFGKFNTTCTIPSLTRKNIEGILLRLPSLGGQKETAAQLDSILKQIALAQQEIAGLDSLVKSRFVEMFGDITERYLLGERLETTSGGTPSRKYPEYYEGGSIPWLTSGEVNKGKIDTPDHFITEAGFRNSSAKLVPANSVVVAMYGATAGQVGLVTYETTTNQAVCCIKPNAQVAPVFLRYALEFKKDWMIDQCAGGAQPNISQGIIKKVAIPDVAQAKQQEFAAFVAQVDKSRFVRDHEINFRWERFTLSWSTIA